MPELENSQFITMEVLKEMLAMQKDSYQMSVKMLVEDIRQEVRDIRKEVQELSTSVSFLNAKYDDIKDDIGKIETRVNAAFIQMEAMHKDVNADFETIITKHDYLENQSRRNNIKIFGVPEDPDEKTWNDTEFIVKTVIKNELGIQDADKIEIERAHRVGSIKGKADDRKHPQSHPAKEEGSRHLESASKKEHQQEPRPIVANIKSWKTKERILKTAREKRPKTVKFLNDFSQRTLQKRREQIPKMLEERKKGNTAFLIMDKLVIYEKTRNRKSVRQSLNSNSSFDSDVIIQNQNG